MAASAVTRAVMVTGSMDEGRAGSFVSSLAKGGRPSRVATVFSVPGVPPSTRRRSPCTGISGVSERTTSSLREDRQFVVPSKRTEPLELREEGTDPCEALIKDYEASRDLKAKVKGVENLIKDVNLFEDGATKLKTVAETIGEDGRKGVAVRLQCD